MKQFLYSAFAAIIMFAVVACTNDDIEVTSTRDVEVKVSTESLYTPLDIADYQDHLGKNSNSYITTNLLIYNNEGKLIKEETQQTRTFNTISFNFTDITTGTYTIVALQTIKNNNDKLGTNDLSYYWTLTDKEKFSTLHVDKKRLETYWYAALGMTAQQVSVNEKSKSVSLLPQPMGYIVGFGYENAKNSNLVEVAFYNHNTMDGLYVDPSRTGNDRFYKKEYNQRNTWDYIGYFLNKDNGVDDNASEYLFAIENGTQTVCIGHSDATQEEKGQFTAVPQNGVNVNFENGKTYAAYGIYNESTQTFDCYIGGVDDFNAWYNAYKHPTTTTYFAEPMTQWGATVNSVKNFMSSYECGNENGELLEDNGYYILWYKGKYKEDEVDYYFNEKTGDLARSYVFIDKEVIDNDGLTAYIEQLGYTFAAASDDGMTKRFVSKDANTIVETGLNEGGYWYVCFFTPNDNNAAAKSIKRQAKRNR